MPSSPSSREGGTIPMWQRTRRSLTIWAGTWWPVCVIAMLVAGLLYQKWQFTHPVRTEPIRVGARLSTLSLTDLEGRSTSVGWDRLDKPTLIYLFRPDCQWCRRNEGAVKALMTKASDHYRVFAVSVTGKGLSEYL